MIDEGTPETETTELGADDPAPAEGDPAATPDADPAADPATDPAAAPAAEPEPEAAPEPADLSTSDKIKAWVRAEIEHALAGHSRETRETTFNP